MAADKRRQCVACGRNRAERFFSGPRGRTCQACRRKKAAKSRHERRVVDTYGLQEGDYDLLFQAQGGLCAICEEPRRENLSVDHDHKTGAVRGLACRRCNGTLLAKGARDRPDVLRRAADYLENPPAFGVIGVRGIDEEYEEEIMALWDAGELTFDEIAKSIKQQKDVRAKEAGADDEPKPRFRNQRRNYRK